MAREVSLEHQTQDVTDFFGRYCDGCRGLIGEAQTHGGDDGHKLYVSLLTREHLILNKQLGLRHLVVFINKCDAVDEEMIKLVEIKIRELLEEMGFSEDSTPIGKGSLICALEDTKPELGIGRSCDIIRLKML